MSLFIYKQICRKCKEEKPEANMVHSRGRAITLCLECANKSKQYDKRLKSKERHPWQKDYQKTSRLKYNPPTDFVDIIENE